MGSTAAVGPHRLADWLQEAAAHHCEAAGWPVERLRAEGWVWFVRELIVWLGRPIRFRESVEVETWVSDLRRFRTHREYRVRVGEEIVARARADWLFLQVTDRGLRPRRPPEAMQASFPFDTETALAGIEVPDWPSPEPPAAPPAARMERRVMPSELDENGHANHVNHLAWLEDLAASTGAGRLRLACLEYLKDAGPWETVAVESYPLGSGAAYARVERAGEVLVRALVLRDDEGVPGARTP